MFHDVFLQKSLPRGGFYLTLMTSLVWIPQVWQYLMGVHGWQSSWQSCSPHRLKSHWRRQKIATVTASVLPPAFMLLPHAAHGFLYISILLVSLSTQQIKHWLSSNCGQHTSASVFRGHGWKPWRSWRVSAAPLSSNRCEGRQCWKCIIAVPAHLRRSGLSDTFFPGVLGAEPSLAGKTVPALSHYWWFGH